MNYLKYFLFSLILLWLLGFFYVFKSGNYGSESSPNVANRNLNEDDDTDSSVYNRRSSIQLKRLEEELQRLEMKNKKNELIIKQLQEQAGKLSANKNQVKNNQESLHDGSNDSKCKCVLVYN